MLTETTDVAALTIQATANPHDETVVGMLFDAFCEAGATPLAARRRVNQVIRAGEFAEVRGRIDDAGAKATRLRSRIRSACSAHNTCPITVVQGDQSPSLSGEGAYHTFRKSNGRCEYPGAALRKGYKLDYHPSSFMVTVGHEWVLRVEREGK